MDWFHRYHKDATNDAAINSKDNKKVEKVQLLNKFLYDKSSEFGMTMQENLLLNPSLSYTKDRPTEQAARSTYLQMEREKKIRAVRELAEAGWGLFFLSIRAITHWPGNWRRQCSSLPILTVSRYWA